MLIERTARMKRAAGGEIHWRRDRIVTGGCGGGVESSAPLARIGDRNGRQQQTRVRVPGVIVQRLGRGLFDDSPEIHDCDR